ncbi:hypothetical protein TNCV_1270601 [Trichonephila clavipes]|nr:hypothetical protein TNCV_1270601 [Trichonephila clavipes]
MYTQRYLHTLESWLTDWRIAINVDKTQAIVFRKHGRKLIPKTLSLFDEDIEWVNVLLLPSAIVRVVCRSDRFSQFSCLAPPVASWLALPPLVVPPLPSFGLLSHVGLRPSLPFILSRSARSLSLAIDLIFVRFVPPR